MAGQSGQLEVWDPKAAIETTTTTTSEAAAPMAPTAATKPLYVLWAPAHSSQLMQISSAHLLALPGRIGDVHVSYFWLYRLRLPIPSRFSIFQVHCLYKTVFSISFSPSGVGFH